MTSPLISNPSDGQDFDGFILTTKDDVVVGWITWNIRTREYETLMLTIGCSDGMTFSSLEAAEYCAFAHHCEDKETQT